MTDMGSILSQFVFLVDTAQTRILTWWGGPQSVFINSALDDIEIEVHGTGQQTRSFTYISDHVDGLVGIIQHPEVNNLVLKSRRH